MDKRQRFQAPVVGGSSLLVIFAVLCLTVFALLSLSTVQADSRLSDASAAAVSGYYAADCRAEELLAELRSGQIPEGVNVNGDVYSYTCPISETQELQVEVQIRDDSWEILQWKAVSTAQWNEDDTLSLWDGEPLF